MDRGYRQGARAAAPITVAAFGFGLSFGVLAVAAGMGKVAPIVMSMTTFAGSAQFAATSVLGTGGAAATAILTAVLLNARYAALGVTVAPSLQGGFWSRLLHAHLMVDESWALAAEPGARWNPRVLAAAGVGIWVGWVGGTVVGVLFGDVIGDPMRLGLDAAFPALFLALVAAQLGSKVSRRAAALGAVIGLALTPVTPAGVPIVAASAAALLGLRSKDDAS